MLEVRDEWINLALKDSDVEDLVSISGNEYFNKIKYEY